MSTFYDPIPNEKTLLWYSTNLTVPSWVEVGNITSVQAPGRKRETVESVIKNASRRRYRANRNNQLGQLKFAVEYTPNQAAHRTIRGLLGTIVLWKVEYPDGNTTKAKDVFPGFMTKFEPKEQGTTGNLEVDLEVQATAKTTTTPGS